MIYLSQNYTHTSEGNIDLKLLVYALDYGQTKIGLLSLTHTKVGL